MNIVVLAGGLSTERDVSFKTGDMVAKALRENGHQVNLYLMYLWDTVIKKEDLTGIFDRSEEVSVKVSGIPEIAPDLAKVKASRKDQSDCFFGPNVINMCRMADIVSWHYTEKTERMARFRQLLICLESSIPEPII